MSDMFQSGKVQEILEDAWLNVDFTKHTLIKPVDLVFCEDPDEMYLRLAWLFTRPEYLAATCKYIMNVDLLPFQAAIISELWQRKFPMLIGSRGCGKSWLLSVYAMLRALLMPKRKVVIVGAAFRQSKVLYDYCDVLWKNAPIMRDLCDSDSGLFKETDMCKVIMNGNRITMLPLGSGEKIRGQRATEIIADEFASIPRDIFENVIAGFGVVSSTPTDNVKKLATLKKASEMNISLKASDYELPMENQIVLSGTAYYDFNHFADYWKKWCKIIRSKGDHSRLKEVFNGEIPKDFKWQDYSVIRLPYNLLPDGVMDGGQISRSKATIHTGIFDMEFGAKFSKDSNGFFKRSLIEYCVPKFDNPIISKSGEPISFAPLMYGDRNKYYVIGVDPASEVDKFSISVIELNADHRRIVHQWTTDRKTFLEKRKQGKTSEDDFYWYAARKIRSLMEVFPCRHIAMDSQGGGIPISEALHNVKNLRDGEVPIWPIIDPLKEKPTDGESGLHILEMCNFSDSKWLSEANHGLRFDFEQRSLIFPTFDPLVIGFAAEEDMATGRQTDTLEELIFEIEELKNELSIIEITQTAAGRDKWDTPEVKTGVGKKGRLRKDRYSSLVMANMAGRQIQNKRVQDPYESYGGFSSPTTKSDDTGKMFIGPSWFTEKMGDVY
jgi:hypothetical protein